jgi:antitoxin HicB
MINIDEVLKRPYARVITPDPEGGYTAGVAEFPGCVTQGETVEEAYANLEDAARGWLEAVIEANQSVPEPLAAAEDFSGKVVLRLPKSLHQKASRYAEREDVSLNTFLVTAIAHYVGERSSDRAVARHEVTEVRIVHGGKRRRGSSFIYGGVESSIATAARPSKGLLVESNSHKAAKSVKKR